MPLMRRITEEAVGYASGTSKAAVVDGLPWHELTPHELWDRLLGRSILIKRCFPNHAFLKALDSPEY